MLQSSSSHPRLHTVACEDYDDTFSPVLKLTSVHLIFTLAAGKSLHAHHLDVKIAFLIPSIDRTIYVEQPPEFKDPKYPRDKFICIVTQQKSLPV